MQRIRGVGGYCGIKMEKLVLWDSSSLKLFQKIEPFILAFEVMLVMCVQTRRVLCQGEFLVI